MGNLSFIIPKENLQDFTNIGIVKIIEDNLREKLKLDIELHSTGQIIITNKNGDTVCEMWNQKDGCYLLAEGGSDEANGDKHEEWLRNKLKEVNLKQSEPCFGISYGYSFDSEKLRSKIITFLIKHFKGYWLDEGIHPEFITHDDEYLNKYV